MVTTPVVTGTFGYMFTAPHYYFGLLVSVVGVYLLCKGHRWQSLLGAVLLFACAIGIYQAILPCILTLVLIYLVRECLTWEAFTFSKGLMLVLRLAAGCIGGLVVYFLLNKLYLIVLGAQLGEYQQIDQMGKLPLSTYLSRAVYAYKEFLKPNRDSSAFMYPTAWMMVIYRAAQLMAVVLTITALVRRGKENLIGAILGFIVTIMLPLTALFIYVMSDPSTVHTLMVYGHVMLFVYILMIAQSQYVGSQPLWRLCGRAVCLLVLLLSLLYVRFDNVCYMKAEFVERQTVSYYNTLLARIQCAEGYDDTLPVNFVNFFDKHEQTLVDNKEFRDVNIIPYLDSDSMINSFAGYSFLEHHYGYYPNYDFSDMAQHPDVQKMPCYPDDGSIRVVDGILVVKFS